jgi:arginase
MRVELITVPYDSGRRRERMGAGPDHLLGLGFADRLAEAGHDVGIRVLEAQASIWNVEAGTTFDLARGVASAVRAAADAEAFPLILSGNCGPAALGAVAGLRRTEAVLWFDAHGDFNTPETTVSGFLDGMALATLTGRCWVRLASAVPGFAPIPDACVALLGARDLDPLELAALDESSVRRITPVGLRSQLPGLLTDLGRRGGQAYIHVDLDVLDLAEARANDFAAANGISLADLQWATASITQVLQVGAAALTAYDPTVDNSGAAAQAAIRMGVVLVDNVARSRGA